MADQKLKVIIPVYNAEKYIKKCLKSVTDQIYTNWIAIVINDASTDNTGKIAKEFCNSDKRFTYIENSKNVGALANIVTGIDKICKHEEDIIVLLDGDDWLFNNEALDFVNAIYQEQSVWITYGQYADVGGKPGCNDFVDIDSGHLRVTSWRTSHLRTFKNKLWKKVKNSDLKDKSGNYYAMAWDLAIMYPMLEMAGNDRTRFINKILYTYNNSNPLNDHKKNNTLQLCLTREIKEKKPYKRI